MAADVCRALELGETLVALRRLDEDEKGRFSTPTLGGCQEMSIVSESGLYALYRKRDCLSTSVEKSIIFEAKSIDMSMEMQYNDYEKYHKR